MKLEKALLKKKDEYDNIKAPSEMEDRIKIALDSVNIRHKFSTSNIIKAACLLFAVLFFGYNLDTLAYYTKKLVGYDTIMNDSLKEINNLGKGQQIGKSYTFKNGTTVTLDGIMLDDNQLLLFYTERNPYGNIDENGINSIMNLKGLIGNYLSTSGRGQENDAKTEIKWIMGFNTPNFFEKKLKWNFAVIGNGQNEEGTIEFSLDRNKAMGHSLKMKLNKEIDIDGKNIKLDSILASPTTTVIKGTIEDSLEMTKDYIENGPIEPRNIEFRLIANGTEIENQGSSLSTNLNGIKFSNSFEPLPNPLNTLQLILVNFQTNCNADKRIILDKNKKTLDFEVLGQKIRVMNIYEKNSDTYITISSKADVLLSKVYLIEDNKKVELAETILNQEDKNEDGTITHTRTLHFKGTGSKLELNIERISFNKECNTIVDIK